MLIKDLLEKLTGLPLDAEVRISFTEEIFEEGEWYEYDTTSSVSDVEIDAENNTVTLTEDES